MASRILESRRERKALSELLSRREQLALLHRRTCAPTCSRRREELRGQLTDISH